MYNVIDYHADTDGRMVLVNIEISNTQYTLVNIYAPNTVAEHIAFYHKINSFIKLHAIAKSKLIIGGDFNCVLNASDRASRSVDRSTTVLIDIVKQLNVEDMWRCLNPNDIECTYIDPSPNMSNSRIYLLLCSHTLKSLCVSSKICQAPAPDHKVVKLVFKASVNSRGKGYWKMNNTFLNSKEYEVGIIEVFNNNVISQYGQHVSNSLLWDYLKLKIKEFSISFGIKQAQHNKDKCRELESQLDYLDEKLSKCKEESVRQERINIKVKLDEHYKNKAMGYQIRARAKWVEEGEQSTKYFLGLEKSRQNFNCINSLKDSCGLSVTSDKEILEIARGFYLKLYKNKSVRDEDINAVFDSTIPEKVLTEDLQEKCEGLVSKDECFRAIKSMKRNKAPGLDGISTEFYEHFWSLLGDLLVNVFNESYENEILPSSQRSAVMTLIFKQGDREDISNYQPISLTNVDYRILAFILSARLQGVIESIVSPDQTAYIKNRYMGNNIRLVEDILEYYDHMEKKGLIFMADFTKAFDSLEWDFMFRTLDFF